MGDRGKEKMPDGERGGEQWSGGKHKGNAREERRRKRVETKDLLSGPQRGG